MTKFKKLIAFFLVLSIIVGTMLVITSAIAPEDVNTTWPADYASFGTGEGNSFGVKTQFFDEDDNPISRAAPGDTVYLRIWIISDFYSNSAQFVLSFPKDVFEVDYYQGDAITYNRTKGSFSNNNRPNGIATTISANYYNPGIEVDCFNAGYIDQAFLDAYDYAFLQVSMNKTVLWNDPVNWLCELELIVNENLDDVDAVGEFFVDARLIKDKNHKKALSTMSKSVNEGANSGDEFSSWSAIPDATLVAEPVTFASEIIFDANEGTFAQGAKTEHKGIINTSFSGTEPSVTAPTGKSFVGWNTDPDATTGVTSLSDVTFGYEDVTYYAIYAYDPVTVKFSANGGNFAEGAVTEIEEYPGEAIECPAVSRTGYEFVGWNADINATTGEKTLIVPYEDTLYFAIWKAGVFDAVFMLNGETYATVPTEFKQQIIAPDDPTTPTGYAFSGWSPEVGVMDEEGKIFTATLNPVDCSVKFILNGGNIEGNEADITDTVKFDSVITPPADPVLTGHRFTGWVDSDTQTVVTFDAENPVMDNVSGKTYTASWEKQEFKVEFIDFYGNVYHTETVMCGSVITLPSTDPADIFASDSVHVIATFEGWKDVPAEMPANDLRIYSDYKDVSVKLIPAAGMTTVVDRSGYTETIADFDGVAGTDYTAYTDSTDSEKAHWFVYGLTTELDENLLRSYVDYTGDGRIEIIPYTVSGGVAKEYGTGAVINLYNVNGTPDNTADDTLVESFFVVVFGDVNGDSIITTADVSFAKTSAAYAHAEDERWESDQITYRFMAGNINGDDKITTGDAASISAAAAYASTIDQATRVVTPNA